MHVLNDRFIDLANSAIIVSIAIMISIIAIGSFNNLLWKRASLQGKSDSSPIERVASRLCAFNMRSRKKTPLLTI